MSTTSDFNNGSKNMEITTAFISATTLGYSNITDAFNNSTNSSSNDVADKVLLLNDPFEAVMAFLQFALCIMIFFGNSLTQIAPYMAPSLRTIQNKYIISLSAADQMVGMAVAHLLIYNYLFSEKSMGHWATCQPDVAMFYTCTAVSLLHMLSIAIDRYIFIVHPFFYRRHVTGRRTNIIITAQWLLALSYGHIPIYVLNLGIEEGCNPFFIFQRDFIAYSHPMFFFIDCIGIGVTYGMIAKVAKGHQDRRNKRIQQINELMSKNSGSVAKEEVANGQNSQSESGQQIIKTSGVLLEYNMDKAGDEIADEKSQNDTDKAKESSSKNLNSNVTEEPTDDTTQQLQTPVSSAHVVNQHVAHKQDASDTSPKKGTRQAIQEPKQLQQNGNPISLSSLRWMKQMVLVFGLFFVCWTPSMVGILLSTVYQLGHRTVYILSMFGLSNSAVNFYVYSLYNKQFRAAIKDVLLCRWKKRKNGPRSCG